MMPTTLYILVITTINSFQCFALIQLLTQGGSDTNTVMFYIYWTAFKLTEQAGHFGYANAMGVVLALSLIHILTASWEKYFTPQPMSPDHSSRMAAGEASTGTKASSDVYKIQTRTCLRET